MDTILEEDFSRVSIRDMYKSVTYDLLRAGRDNAKQAYRASKSRIGKTRVGSFAHRGITRLNRFVDNPRTIKVTTALLGVETIIGFFGCIGTATIMFASGNVIFGVGAIGMYLLGLFVRYTMARAAIHETQEA